jgi:hypothetical protein
VRILFWIFRILLILIVVRLVLRALYGFVRASRSGGAPRPPGQMRERVGGELVRDPNCGTFIPRSTAIAAGSGAAAQFFCSERCRDEYAARAGARSGS